MKRTLLIVTLLFLVNSVSISQTAIKKQALNPNIELIKSAYNAYQNSDYQNALNLINDYTDKEKNDYYAYYLRAKIEWLINSDNVLNDLNKSLNINPNFSDALYERALFESGNNKQAALNDLYNAIKKSPKGVNISYYYSLRADIDVDLLDWISVFEDSNKAILLDNTNGNAYRSLAQYYIEKEDFYKAIDNCDKAIHIDPINDAFPFYYRGLAKAKLNKMDSACSDFNMAKRIIKTDQFDDVINKYCK